MALEEIIKHNHDTVEVDCFDSFMDFFLTKLGRMNRRIQGWLDVAASRMDGYLWISIHNTAGTYRFAAIEEGYTVRKSNSGIRGEMQIYRPDGTPAQSEYNGKVWVSKVSGATILEANKIKILECSHKS